MDTETSNRFSVVCNVIKNQSSDFSSPLSTLFKVTKGRGSQKEETRCISRSLIMLLPNLAEQRRAWLATNIKWIKRNPMKIIVLVLTSVVTASRFLLKYFWNSIAKTVDSSFEVASTPTLPTNH